MLHKTRGIVLHKTKYSDTSLVVKVYTEEMGLQSYLVQGVRGKRSKNKANLFQPLTLLDLVVYHKEKSTLHRIKELKLSHPFTSIPYNMTKSAITQFLNEVLYKSLREESPNPELFAFLASAIEFLDLTDGNCNNFHLLFMVKLSRFLGFYPQGVFSQAQPYFDLMEGLFRPVIPPHQQFLSAELSGYLWALLGTNFAGCEGIRLANSTRKELLNKLIDYYRVHLDSLKEIRSHTVLEAVVGS